MLKSVKISLLSVVLIAFVACSTGAQSQLVGDLDGNYHVGFKDLQMFALQWLNPDCHVLDCIADLDDANGVDMVDFALLAANWQEMRACFVISEFMAINETSFSTTVEGREVYSDWIEIYNTSA